jgi:hypothetical protein
MSALYAAAQHLETGKRPQESKKGAGKKAGQVWPRLRP